MSRKDSIITRIDIGLDSFIKKKQQELMIKENKKVTYLDTCKKIKGILIRIDIDDEFKL
jgi:hypothetical protein